MDGLKERRNNGRLYAFILAGSLAANGGTIYAGSRVAEELRFLQERLGTIEAQTVRLERQSELRQQAVETRLRELEREIQLLRRENEWAKQKRR